MRFATKVKGLFGKNELESEMTSTKQHLETGAKHDKAKEILKGSDSDNEDDEHVPEMMRLESNSDEGHKEDDYELEYEKDIQ